jgi:uncharacterized lipoprotein YddW (UPF0748 family)
MEQRPGRMGGQREGWAAQELGLRGVWIASHHHSAVWRSREALARALDQLVAQGWTTIFPAVWNRGHTAWPSAVMERHGLPGQDPFFAEAGVDPLALVVALGQERGLAVIPWLEYGFAAEPVGAPGPLLAARPNWAALDRRGQVVDHGGLRWLNPLDPEVGRFLAALVLEVVERYGVEGAQGDDHIALPCGGSHDAATLARYRQATGARPPARDGDPRWSQYRQREISRWVREMGERLHRARPGLMWCLSPCPPPTGPDQLMQDSAAWLAEGQVDLLVPQWYCATVSGFQRTMRRGLASIPLERRRQVVAGLALRPNGRDLEPDTLRRMVTHCREAGLGGVAVFHHGWLGVGGGPVWASAPS